MFLTQIVGSQASKDSGKIYQYFIGEITQSLTSQLTNQILEGKKSILEIATEINQISSSTSKVIEKEFDKYGLELVNFNVESINIPEDELKKIQEVFYKTLEAKELSKTQTGGAYAQIKSFGILEDAANNTSDGTVGAMLGAGIGLGAGLPAGQKIGQQITTDNDNADSNKNKSIPDKLKELKKLLDDGLISEDQYTQKQKELIDKM